MRITPYVSQQPVDDFGLNFSTLKFSASLAASTNTSLTVPGDAQNYKVLVRVANDGLVWVSVGDAAELPGGSTFAATNSELVNDKATLCREVKAGQVLNFITATADTDVSVSFFSTFSNI